MSIWVLGDFVRLPLSSGILKRVPPDVQAQDMLADAVHMAFKQLVIALQSELELVLPSLLSDRSEHVWQVG